MNLLRLITILSLGIVLACGFYTYDQLHVRSDASIPIDEMPIDAKALDLRGRLSAINVDDALSRPLFNPSRRPIVDTPAPKNDAEGRDKLAIDDLKIVAIIFSGDIRFAMIRTRESRDKPLKVKVGDLIEGWIVQDLTRGTVTLSNGGKTEVLTIERENS